MIGVGTRTVRKRDPVAPADGAPSQPTGVDDWRRPPTSFGYAKRRRIAQAAHQSPPRVCRVRASYAAWPVRQAGQPAGEAAFLFLYFLKMFFTEIYFWFHNLTVLYPYRPAGVGTYM